MTTQTTQAHIPNSKSEINLIILHVDINGIKYKPEELKLLMHNTHADNITIQETKLIPKAKKLPIYCIYFSVSGSVCLVCCVSESVCELFGETISNMFSVVVILVLLWSC